MKRSRKAAKRLEARKRDYDAMTARSDFKGNKGRSPAYHRPGSNSK